MIELEKLYLDGWLSYDKTNLLLNKRGITLIKGSIGSGKSAIFEAIYYLLFGKTIRDKDSVNSLANKLLNNGYEIALDLKINETPCKIKEIRNRAEKGLYFYKGDTLTLGSTDVETRKIINEAIGISPSEFRAIALFGQKQSQILLEGSSGERASAIVDIFGLDKYDTAIKVCTERVKEENSKNQQHTEEIEKITKEIDNFDKLLKENCSLDDATVEEKRSKLIKIEEAIVTIEDKLKKLASIATVNRQLVGKADVLKAQAKQAKTLEKELSELRSTLINSEWPNFTPEELEEQIQILRDEKAKYVNIISQNELEINNAKKYENVCPINQKTCPVNVPVEFKDKTISSCKGIINKAAKEVEGIEESLDELKKDIKLAKQRNDIIADTKTKTNMLKQIDNLEIPDTENSIAQIDKCEQAIEKGNIKLREYKEVKNSLKIDLAVYEKTKTFQKNIESSIVECKERLSEEKNKLEESSIELKYLSAALSVLKKAKVYKIDIVLHLLNKYVNEILEKISDEEYKAQFVSQQSNSTGSKMLDKIGIIVSDPHKTIPVELCSGGQNTEVGLAVLLGTWKAASTLSIKSVSSLWLDEVFGSLDQDTVDRVFQAVVDVAYELGTHSVKIISHRELDPRLFDCVWNVELKDGISKVRIT